MNAYTRRGACPALSAPMLTGDGFLVRLNPIAEGLTPAELRALCAAALAHGNGLAEVTQRGNLQIRGLSLGSAARLARDVDALGIAVRTGVPVETGRLAGLDPDEAADPRPLAEALRSGIAAAGLEGRLGPKVSVVLDGGGQSLLDEVGADLRLTAISGALWQVALAGDAASARPLGLFDESGASALALRLLSAIADLGPAARARDLDAELIAGLSAANRVGALPGPTPSGLPAIFARGENGSSNAGDGRFSPLAGEMAAKQPEGVAEDRLRHGSVRDNEWASPDPWLLTLRDARSALRIALPFGSAEASTLAAFAAQAAAMGVEDIRLAPRRTLFALCPDRIPARALRDTAGRLGLIVSPADPRLHVAACAGAPRCASGHIPARELAEELAADLPRDGDFLLHVSGCAKGCAHPGRATLTLVGSESGTALVVGGTARSAPAAYAGDARRGVRSLLALVAGQRRAGETAGAALARLEETRLAAAIAEG